MILALLVGFALIGGLVTWYLLGNAIDCEREAAKMKLEAALRAYRQMLREADDANEACRKATAAANDLLRQRDELKNELQELSVRLRAAPR